VLEIVFVYIPMRLRAPWWKSV